MTSPLPPFPATMWVGQMGPKKSNGWKIWRKAPAPGGTLFEVDAATSLAGLTWAGLVLAVHWREVSLPLYVNDPEWAQPHLASLRPAWDQIKAQSKADGYDADALVTLDLSGGSLLEWLHQNRFATFLQFALLYLTENKEFVRMTAGRVVAILDGGKDMRTLLLESDMYTCSPATMDSHDLDPVADTLTALFRSYAATNPEIEVGLMRNLTPYLVGPTPQDQWMRPDRALAYMTADIDVPEARNLEFGDAVNCPTLDALHMMAALLRSPR